MSRGEILILTSDTMLVATLGGKLRGWGADVRHADPGQAQGMPGKTVEVVLVDVRRQAEESLLRLKAILAERPFAEAVLINSSANIGASMAGMKAGASDELIVPFDAVTLRQKLDAACDRSRRRRKKKTKKSLLAAFGEAMSAATFAQAGEFEEAVAILNGSATGKNQDDAADGKKEPGP